MFGCRFFHSLITHPLIFARMHQGYLILRLPKANTLFSTSSSLSCLFPSLSLVYTGAACFFERLIWVGVQRDKGAGQPYRWMRGFLWWCTVGEWGRAASWHERGGGDDELDVNKLSLPTQHSAHCNKQKQQRHPPDKPGVINNQTAVHSVPPTEVRYKPQVRLGRVKWKWMRREEKETCIKRGFCFKLQFYLVKVRKTAAKFLSPSRLTFMSQLTPKWLTTAGQGLANVATTILKLFFNCSSQNQSNQQKNMSWDNLVPLLCFWLPWCCQEISKRFNTSFPFPLFDLALWETHKSIRTERFDKNCTFSFYD